TGQYADVPVNQASPSTAFGAYDDERKNPRQVFRNAESCSAEETTARAYSLATDSSVVKYARLVSDNLCLAQCDGMERFQEIPSPIEKMRYINAYPSTQIFAPQYAQMCNSSEVGCEEFTNTKTEQREYFSKVESCVLDTNQNIATFFTWEGGGASGFQLKSWQLLKDNVQTTGKEFGPCTEFPQGTYGTVDSPSSVGCYDNTSSTDKSDGNPQTPSPSCSQDPSDTQNYSPTCTVFLDEGGKEYYRDMQRIVTASNECTTYRRVATPEGVANQENWYFISQEANRCSQSSVACHEYKGKKGNSPRIISFDDFEDDNEYWEINGNATGGRQIGAVAANEYYYHLNAEEFITKQGINLRENVDEYYVFTGKTFMVRFLARSLDGGKIKKISFGQGQDSQEFPTDKTRNNPGDRTTDLTERWAPYEVGPLVKITDQDFLQIQAQAGSIDIDKIELVQIEDVFFALKKSTLPQSQGGSQPNACFNADATPIYNSCQAYNDNNKNTYYISGFNKLFNSNAINCRPVIATQNFSSPYAQVFGMGTDKQGTERSYTVNADSLAYLRISAGQAAPRNSAGCKELGVLQSDISWRSTYKIVDPDTFIGGTLCNAEALGCEAFTSKSGTYVFRDPGEDVCSWNPDIGNGGGFVDKHGNNCPQNPPMAKQCAPEQSSCTAYLPTDPKLSEGANTAKFMLADSVNKGDCSSVNNDIGCVNFKVNYSTTGEGTSIPPSKIGPDERDTVIEVDQARQCAEWFAPTTTSLVDDPQSRSKREVVYDFGRCQKLGDNGA
ncbi:MAG: hypothetical protein COU72_04095, partial [Parcubacteria group bacterium CG10_big_fil_rev_8_21_14_0_10_41_35]